MCDLPRPLSSKVYKVLPFFLYGNKIIKINTFPSQFIDVSFKLGLEYPSKCF